MAGPSYSKTYQDDLSTTTTNNYFTIDFSDFLETKQWGFSAFSAGAQAISSQNVKVELFYDAEGDASNLELIDAIYTQGETYQHKLNVSVMFPYTPNVSRVLVRRTLFGGVSAQQVYANWQGSVV